MNNPIKRNPSPPNFETKLGTDPLWNEREPKVFDDSLEELERIREENETLKYEMKKLEESLRKIHVSHQNDRLELEQQLAKLIQWRIERESTNRKT